MAWRRLHTSGISSASGTLASSLPSFRNVLLDERGMQCVFFFLNFFVFLKKSIHTDTMGFVWKVLLLVQRARWLWVGTVVLFCLEGAPSHHSRLATGTKVLPRPQYEQPPKQKQKSSEVPSNFCNGFSNKRNIYLFRVCFLTDKCRTYAARSVRSVLVHLLAGFLSGEVTVL